METGFPENMSVEISPLLNTRGSSTLLARFFVRVDCEDDSRRQLAHGL
jgi:hypothetical protein